MKSITKSQNEIIIFHSFVKTLQGCNNVLIVILKYYICRAIIFIRHLHYDIQIRTKCPLFCKNKSKTNMLRS